MARLRYVCFWPSSGHPDGPWSENAAEDAFARTSRRVTERYSEALENSGIEARRSMFQMFVSGTGRLRSHVDLELHLRPAGDEAIRALVPMAVAEMPPQERARLVLEVVDTAMQRIAIERDWPQEPLARARQHAFCDELTFEMTGAWRTNPPRRRRVRPVGRIADDGWTDLAFEVTDYNSGESLGFTTTMRDPYNRLPGFTESTRRARWADHETLERPHAWGTRFEKQWEPVDTYDIDDIHAWPQESSPMPLESPLPVEVRQF